MCASLKTVGKIALSLVLMCSFVTLAVGCDEESVLLEIMEGLVDEYGAELNEPLGGSGDSWGDDSVDESPGGWGSGWHDDNDATPISIP